MNSKAYKTQAKFNTERNGRSNISIQFKKFSHVFNESIDLFIWINSVLSCRPSSCLAITVMISPEVNGLVITSLSSQFFDFCFQDFKVIHF